MVIYSCNCLNILIFAEPPLEVNTDVADNCPLGSNAEAVELIDQGFQFVHKCLVHRSRSGPWTIYSCVPCHIRTHAVNHEEKTVVVSAGMQKGEAAVERLKSRPDFSPVFQLLLAPVDSGSRDEDLKPQSYDNLQQQLTELQKVLSHYIKHEEEAMERRIRNYEEDERSKLAALQERAQAEKARLISNLFSKCESQNPSADEKAPGRYHASLGQSKSVNNEVTNYGVGGNSGYRIPEEDVFDMDEIDLEELILNDENSNMPEPRRVRSDQRTRLDNDVNNSRSSRSRSRGKDVSAEAAREARSSPQLMSTSVPISMPVMPRNLRKTSHIEDDIEESAEFADIPRNMQALSESIQERDRYIFGDRPRQRVNTGDFTQVNWR